MPEITHLAIGPHLWEVVFSWVINIPNLFPCLKTLELNFKENDRDVGLISYGTLPGVVSRTGTEYLELNGDCYFDDEAESVETLLDQRGVVVAYDQDDTEPVGQRLLELSCVYRYNDSYTSQN